MDQEVIILINIMIKRQGFDTLISEFCDGIEIIESNDFYESIMKLIEMESLRDKIIQCKEQFENIDATIVMPHEYSRPRKLRFRNFGNRRSGGRKPIDWLDYHVSGIVVLSSP